MHDYCRLLQEAAVICPSLVTDETYQRKRAGMLGQIVNQGRALARYYTSEIIAKIRRRVENGSLNQGLRMSLPYFDESDLAMHLHEIDVIPSGRVPFVAAFVARAMQLETERVTRSLHINRSTRKQLLALLVTIERAFDPYALKD
jgi:hypothetical protein